MDLLTQYAWLVWVCLVLILAAVEIFTSELTFLMLALGSVLGLLSGLAGASWWLQFIVALTAAALLLAFVRPPLLRRLQRGGDPTPSNIDAIVGQRAIVTLASNSEGKLAQVRLANGEIWTAANTDVALLPLDATVFVVSVSGATVIVAAEKVS